MEPIVLLNIPRDIWGPSMPGLHSWTCQGNTWPWEVCKMALGKDSGHRPDRAVCWSLGYLYMEGGLVSCTPCPVGSTGISRFLSHWWRRPRSLSLEFPGKGLVSVWCLVMGFPWGCRSLATVLTLAATPLVPKLVHLEVWGGERRRLLQALGQGWKSL